MTFAIIVTDVPHNVWMETTYVPPLLRDPMHAARLCEQMLLMVLVVMAIDSGAS